GRRSKAAWWTAYFSITVPRYWVDWRRCRWPAESGGGAARTRSASIKSRSIRFRRTNSRWRGTCKDIWMFTGIIEELGAVESLLMRAAGARLKVRCSTVLSDMAEGASIAVNGVCLTAVDLRPDSFSADLAPETLRRSNLGDLRAGSRVNLERPLSLSGRLSGHIVQGHVDGAGEFLSLEALGDENWWLRIRVPAELDPFLVYKGSIAIDGISLTIAALEARTLSVTIIPHTYRHTTLGGYRAGARVNVECDILAKHVEKLLRRLEFTPPLTLAKLRDQ